MDKVRTKIKTSSVAVAVGLTVIAAFLAVAAVASATHGMSAASLDFARSGDVEPFVYAGMYACLAALLCFVASTFLRIAREETPFFPGLSRRVKIASPLVFLAVALPRWIGFAAVSFARGTASFAVFDEVNVPFLVVAAVLFCLGQVLEYGWLLQDESYEII